MKAKNAFIKIATLAAMALLYCSAMVISTSARAQTPPNNVIFDGSTTFSPCSGDCCLEFTDTIQSSTSTVDIYLWDNGTHGPNCFPSTCWPGQSTVTETFQSGPGTYGYDDFQIAASGIDPMLYGPFPYVIHVYICGTYSCLQNYDTWTWQAGSTIGKPSRLYAVSCESSNIPSCVSGCSYITVAPAGTPYVNCGTEICVHNQSGSLATSVTLNFNPPLASWPPTGCSGPCTLNGSYNSYWTNYAGCENCWVGTLGLGGDVTFTPSGGGCPPAICGGLTSCSDPLCIFIPYCDQPQGETITLEDPSPCSGEDDAIHVALKQDGTFIQLTGDSGAQNYPNPIEASSGFKTTIPFVTSAGGVAMINIVNDKGVKILTNGEELLGAGRHFFYFSAADLPSGTYYYTIEFPQGVVISSKTMLVVK